jgi:hypothetical protein
MLTPIQSRLYRVAVPILSSAFLRVSGVVQEWRRKKVHGALVVLEVRVGVVVRISSTAFRYP